MEKRYNIFHPIWFEMLKAIDQTDMDLIEYDEMLEEFKKYTGFTEDHIDYMFQIIDEEILGF